VYTSDEVITFLDLIASGRLSFKSLVTDVIRLEDCVEQGLERLRRPGSGQVKILISPLAQGR
jgi:threonine dehydrogenase-like Zn-dependent dehydrogenase